ncbi:MAG: cupin domain-containing protein [Bacteroidota bacterium]
MRYKTLSFDSSFSVVLENERAQAAVMTLAPGEKTGGPDNVHSGSDQWLFVVDGAGVAVVDGSEQRLERGGLLLIERGEGHEIRCSGNDSLVTLNLYVPPEY